MASVKECIDKLAGAGTISKTIADEALAFYTRTQAEHARIMGPASADAAAALETAKMLRDRAAAHQLNIAAQVKANRAMERAVIDYPGRRAEGLVAQLSKNTKITPEFRRFANANPDHPAVSGGNADYRFKAVADRLYGAMGAALEQFRPGFLKSQALVSSTQRFIAERFGVTTGDAGAKALSDGFGKAIEMAQDRAKLAGKIFEENEDWRLPQHWTPSRVAEFGPDEYVRDHLAEIASGGLKLFDKETGRYATAAQYEPLLRKAYSDIKTEGGAAAPFSRERRTFQFQPGQAGADSWLKLQAKYGVGNEIIGSVTRHVESMAREIALTEQFGPNPDATFAAALRLVKDDPVQDFRKLGFMYSVNTLQKTYNQIAGKGRPVANETVARIMDGVRNFATMANLRNLPITIIPSDSAMTTLATSYDGMSGFNVLSHVFDGTMTKEVARHLEIQAHGYMDFMNNYVRRYEDQINVSGLTRKVARQFVRATGAELWTQNGRLGFQVSYLNQIDSMRGRAFDALDPTFRDNFLKLYGFTPADWDRIRISTPFTAPNGASYIDPTAIDGQLSERLMMAIKERASYAFHQPDARTTAMASTVEPRGTLKGELLASMVQYKQFALERMTTHLMRILVDGPVENRVMRGLAFTALSMAAGAVSLQAAAVVSGKSPRDMASPKFWIEAFLRSGAGGMYGDILDSAMQGDKAALAGLAGGPVTGLAADTARLVVSPLREEIEGKRQTFGQQALGMGRRWTPNTWYTKLAVDRLLWDKLQVLIDPNYRASFRRAEQATKQQGSDYWWPPGETVPGQR